LSLKLTKFHKNTLDLWCNALCYIAFIYLLVLLMVFRLLPCSKAHYITRLL